MLTPSSCWKAKQAQRSNQDRAVQGLLPAQTLGPGWGGEASAPGPPKTGSLTEDPSSAMEGSTWSIGHPPWCPFAKTVEPESIQTFGGNIQFKGIRVKRETTSWHHQEAKQQTQEAGYSVSDQVYSSSHLLREKDGSRVRDVGHVKLKHKVDFIWILSWTD